MEQPIYRCKKCKGTENIHPYDVADITNDSKKPLMFYRCWCFFCDKCIEIVMLAHKDRFYDRVYTDKERLEIYLKKRSEIEFKKSDY